MDQQPLRRERADDAFIVRSHARDHRGAIVRGRIVRVKADRPQHVEHELRPRAVTSGRRRRQDCRLRRVEPANRITRAENDFRRGVMRADLVIEHAARGVGGGAVTLEQRVPIDGPALGGRDPHRPMRGVRERLAHVVAGAKAQLLERRLQRRRAGARITRADDRKCHEFLPTSPPSLPRRARVSERP